MAEPPVLTMQTSRIASAESLGGQSSLLKNITNEISFFISCFHLKVKYLNTHIHTHISHDGDFLIPKINENSVRQWLINREQGFINNDVCQGREERFYVSIHPYL